jgi:RHS repeat-associated protein
VSEWASGTRQRVRVKVRTAVSVGLIALLPVTMLPEAAWADPSARVKVELPDIPDVQSVAGDDSDASFTVPAAPDTQREYELDAARTVLPTGGRGEVVVQNSATAPTTAAQARTSTAASNNPVKVGALPVYLGPATDTAAKPSTAGTAKSLAAADEPPASTTWQVTVSSRAETEDAGIDGLLMKLQPVAGTAAPVSVDVDYSTFEQLYGADWGSRLQVVRLPECFLTTPDEDGCSDPIDLDSANDLDRDRVSATVDPAMPAAPDETPDDQEDTPEQPENPDLDSETPEEEDTTAEGDGDEPASLTSNATTKAAPDVPKAATPGTGSSGVTTAPQQAANLAAAGSGGVVLAVTGGGASSSGDYAATTLSASGKWTAGTSGGGMSWTYPLQVPPVAAGLKPDITLAYSSQEVDGRTSVTNNQASWVGDGWNYHPGFIERQFRSCTDDRYPNAAKKKANNAKHKTEDLCWPRNSVDTSLVMSLNGSNVPLVKDRKANRWRLAADNGTIVERKLGAENGDQGGETTDRGENWVVTTPDGTRYHFGKHRLPGWSDGKAATNSTFTVPVFGNHPGEPCRKAKFSESACEQAWRWNLDYVEDVNGNAMAVYYDREENHYAKNRKSKAPVSYHRGGNPTRIEYGLRSDSAYSRPAPARVRFEIEERCLNDDTFDCEPEKFTKKGEDAKHWADSPVDTYCGPRSETSKKKKCLVTSPTFWTRKRLDAVTTEVATAPGAGTYRKVDRWQLRQKFLDTRYDTNPPLWLDSIQRTGYAADETAATLPPVVFHANVDPMPNRVSRITDDRPPFERLRIGSIYSETGSSVKVTYSKPCDPDDPKPKPESNDTRCYPVYFSPGGDEAKTPKIDWFNKYVVDRIDEIDHVGGAPSVVTSYEYYDAAWAKDDNEFTKSKERTYNEWRGYARVRTKKGDGADGAKQSLQETRYFRGLSGAVVKDSAGTPIAKDHETLQGQAAETVTYEDASATKVTTRTVTKPWVRRTARQARPVLPHSDKENPAPTADAAAYQSAQRETLTVKRTSTGNRTLRSKVTYHPTFAMPVQVEDAGDAKTTGDEKCTITSYAAATGVHRIGLVASERTTATTCAAAKAGPVTAADVVSDTRNYYDGKPLGQADKGMVTKKETIEGDGAGYQVTEQSTYDELGRAEDVWDAAKQKTHTDYAAGYGAPTTIDVTNPLGHKTSTSFETGRGLAVSKTDANGRLTRLENDPLGRLAKVWMPGRSTGGQSPNIEYTYAVSDQQKKTPTVVTSRTVRDDGSYAVNKTFYDGLLRTRQVQAEAVGGSSRVVSDTFYNSAGTVRRSNDKYPAPGKPTNELFLPTTNTVIPFWTETTYDGLGRSTEVATFHGDVQPAYVAKTSYDDEQTITTPPPGGVATRSTTDVHDRVVTIEQFTNADRTQANTTEYKYNARGDRIRITDAEKNVWTYTYDARGQQTEVNDPDKGQTFFSYDNSGRQLTSRDAAGKVLFNVYDALGRKREEREDSDQGRVRAKWEYDTLAKGVLTSSTKFEKTASGEDAYVNALTGYDTDYQPTGRRISIPAAAGAVKGDYTYAYTYTPTGKLDTTTVPAAGGLRSEKLVMSYTREGQALTTSGLDWYVTDTVYSPFGEVLRSTAGPAPTRVWTTNFYDEHTRRLTRTVNDKEAVTGTDSHRVNDTQYRYDPAGNVLGVADKSGSGATATVDNQCFRYDKLQQLTKAWTAKSATSCDADPAKDTVGGPDPYWRDYTFDKAGNRDTEVLHDAAGDITRDYGYVKGSHKLEKIISASPAGNRQNDYTYDESGNTRTRQEAGATQQLTWEHGRLSSVTDPAKGLTSYIYDADGNRILRRTATGTTLYLGEAEVTAASNGTVTAERYYRQAGAPTVVRSKTASGETLSVMLADHHNTATAAVRLTAGMPVQRRKLTPFGEDRGERPQWWPGQRGFVGGTIDDSTGLQHLGAREYDPAIGRFISVDPVIEPMQPSQLQPYAYAYNSPLTFSDPDGLMGFWGRVGNGGRLGWHDFANPFVSMYNGFRTNPGRTSLNTLVGFGEMLTPWGQTKMAWESAKTAWNFGKAVYQGDVEGATRIATERTLTIGSALIPGGAGRVAAAARGGRGAAAAVEGGGLFRRGANTGPFAGLKVPMQKRVVADTARRAGVDMAGVKTSINRQDDLVGKDLFGHTPNGRRITLYPDAFQDMESLVKTLGHERTHVMQYRLYGPATDNMDLNVRERAAYDIEDQFWTEYKNGH